MYVLSQAQLIEMMIIQNEHQTEDKPIEKPKGPR